MGKLIKDLTTISSIQSDDLILVERNSKGCSIKLSDVLSTKQDVISDLDTIRSGAALGATALQSETYKGTVTGVKINGTTKNPSNGIVDLGTVITSHQDISGKADKSSLATVATSGSYNDLSNKPTIPAAVTESTVSGWGFTKNTGTYTKPGSGIPKSDLASAVQTSLEKADTALQSYTEQYQGTVKAVDTTETIDDVSNDFVTSEQLDARGYATETSVNNEINAINSNIGTNNTTYTISDRITRLENGFDAPDSRSKILWLGTSIPRGDGGSNSYPMMVGEALGVKVYNMSQGGSHLVFNQTAPSWTTYSELSNQYTKHYSLTATIQEYESKMRPVLQNLGNNNQLGGGTVDAWMRLFTANSFENCVIPYIDGTIDACDVVVIDHGFNDKNDIFNLVKSHKDDTKDNGDKWADDAAYNAGQYYPFNGANAGFGWLQTISDNRYLNSWGVYTATWNELNYVKEGKAWYKSDYFKAYMYLVQQIWKINPKIKIIVGNFYALDFGNPWGEGDSSYITKYVIEANKQIAKFMGFQCVNVYEYTGLANRKILLADGTSTTDMALFAPDGIHPSSDTTGESNKRIAAAYINALKGSLYR